MTILEKIKNVFVYIKLLFNPRVKKEDKTNLSSDTIIEISTAVKSLMESIIKSNNLGYRPFYKNVIISTDYNNKFIKCIHLNFIEPEDVNGQN